MPCPCHVVERVIGTVGDGVGDSQVVGPRTTSNLTPTVPAALVGPSFALIGAVGLVAGHLCSNRLDRLTEIQPGAHAEPASVSSRKSDEGGGRDLRLVVFPDHERHRDPDNDDGLSGPESGPRSFRAMMIASVNSMIVTTNPASSH